MYKTMLHVPNLLMPIGQMCLVPKYIEIKGRFIRIFPFLREVPLSCPVKYKEAHTKTNRTALGSHCRAEC